MSYLGGSTIIKPNKTKQWFKKQRRREEFNTEKNNDRIKHENHMKEVTANWQPTYTLIKKEDMVLKDDGKNYTS